ncbi:MAG: methionyl-tRNA synthetase [archaeon GW2011_AR5]|nr:MAG: methionyl-tRNA synthetase [archaeon GW2011_AR5]
MLTNKFHHRVTITSAIPYVNGVKHLGNLVGSILPADIFHRFLDIFCVDNIFICGTDEHGTAVELAALEEGLTPEKYSEKYYKIQKDIYAKWNFDFTFFGRSSSESNHQITRDLFLSGYENGYIKEDIIIVPFCRHDKRFLPDRYIIGTCPVCGYDSARGDQCEKCSTVLDPEQLQNPRCNVCKKQEIEFRKEKHLFLNLPLLEDRLKEWILQQSHWPDNTRNLALGWLKTGLKQRCITRNLKWGVQVPLKGYEHLIFYVWYDAPTAYISMTKDAHDAKIIGDWKSYWKDSRIYQFMGKDNIPFHSIIWPAILLAARDSEHRDTNYSLVHHLAGYEYLNWNGEKFSTSKGVGLFSDEALELFPADYWRFYLASILPESKDSNFDWNDFQSRVNGELIGNYGNLFYRTTYFIEKYFGGAVPTPALGEAERNLQWNLEKTISKVEELVEQVKLREALKETLAFASLVNKYFQDSKPWETVNTDREKAATALYTAVNLLRPISVLLSSYIPESAQKALDCLGGGAELNDKFTIAPGSPVRAEILFRKIEDSEIEKVKKYRTKYIKSGDVPKETADDSITIVDDMLPYKEFQKVDMRVGTITDVKEHPNAEKLYILKVDMGDSQRQVVAGLRQRYTKEQLEGQQIIVLVNLEPRELRGVLSEGMLLAAEDGTILEPASGVQNGSRIM